MESHTMALISRKALDAAVPIATPSKEDRGRGRGRGRGMVGSCNIWFGLFISWVVNLYVMESCYQRTQDSAHTSHRRSHIPG
jgi:hypothetical protein